MIFDRTPTNINQLYPNKFKLNFARLPEVSYFCQGLSIPGVTIGEAKQNTPFLDLYLSGDKMVFDYLTISFIVDEDLQNWESLYKWMRSLAFPVSFDEYRELNKLNKNIAARSTGKPQYSDGMITILKGTNIENKTFKFYDCFPVYISPLPLSTMESPDTIITCTTNIRYSYFDIVDS